MCIRDREDIALPEGSGMGSKWLKGVWNGVPNGLNGVPKGAILGISRDLGFLDLVQIMKWHVHVSPFGPPFGPF